MKNTPVNIMSAIWLLDLVHLVQLVGWLLFAIVILRLYGGLLLYIVCYITITILIVVSVTTTIILLKNTLLSFNIISYFFFQHPISNFQQYSIRHPNCLIVYLDCLSIKNQKSLCHVFDLKWSASLCLGW